MNPVGTITRRVRLPGCDWSAPADYHTTDWEDSARSSRRHPLKATPTRRKTNGK